MWDQKGKIVRRYIKDELIYLIANCSREPRNWPWVSEVESPADHRAVAAHKATSDPCLTQRFFHQRFINCLAHMDWQRVHAMISHHLKLSARELRVQPRCWRWFGIQLFRGRRRFIFLSQRIQSSGHWTVSVPFLPKPKPCLPRLNSISLAGTPSRRRAA